MYWPQTKFGGLVPLDCSRNVHNPFYKHGNLGHRAKKYVPQVSLMHKGYVIFTEHINGGRTKIESMMLISRKQFYSMVR